MRDNISQGSELVISFNGLKMSATVMALRDNHVEVVIPLRIPASTFAGVAAEVVFGGSNRVSFDLGSQGTFTELRVTVPWPDEAINQDGAAPAGPEPQDKPEERRQFFRLPVSIGVEVFDTKSAKNEVRAVGTTINLSGGGMLLNLGAPLLQGVYRFLLHLPDEKVEIRGLVLPRHNLAQGHVAVQFVDFHESTRSRIIRFIFGKLRALRDAKFAPGAEVRKSAGSSKSSLAAKERRAWREERRPRARLRSWRS